VPRTNPQWQALALGHTEFSPISNLGYYGWQQFIANPSSAYALNWPLHAIGDASAPHHVAGTTAWGHRPYEDEVDDLLDTQLLPPPHSCTLMPGLEDASSPTMDPAQATRILTVGYGFWSKYQSQFGQNQLPFREMVLDEAQQAYALAQAGGVYDDPASLLYLVEPTDADRLYSGRADAMRPLLELGTGTMIAFLAGVAKTAQDPGANGSQTCPPGTLWDSSAAVCDATGSPPPSVNPGNPPITLVGGDDDGGGQASCSIATCSDSAPCASGFYCDASGCCQEALK
jgi:hypothetical protein